MKSLEIKPLEKKFTVLIVEKEYNEPFSITETQSTSKPRSMRSLFKPSIGFYRFLENLTQEMRQDFVTEELGMRSQREFYEDNILIKLFRESKIPLFSVDIDENALTYLATDLDKKSELRNEVLSSLENLSKRKNANESMEEEYLIAYGQCLQLELEEQEREIAFPVREHWIVMGIMDHARDITKPDHVTSVHLSSPEHVEGVKRLLESVGASVEVLRLSKKIITSQTEPSSSSEPLSVLKSMQIQVKPVIAKTSEETPFLLFYLDTDGKASPFDICMAYDAGYDAVIPYENVTSEDAKRIIEDALFSRGPKGVKHTCFFIGGRHAEKAEEVLDIAKKTMFSPFKTSIIIDPAGAYTTAAAMVAKVEESLVSSKLGELRGKTCVVLGTGSVGQVAAVLLAKLGCDVTIASLSPTRTDGKEHAEKISKQLAENHGVKVQGVYAPSSKERFNLLKRSDVVMCAGTRGVQLLERSLFNDVKLVKVLVDINAVPPLGVEGLKSKDDMKEIAPGIFGIGALAVGDLKYKLEREILKEARLNGDKIFNYNPALTIARKLLEKSLSMSKLALTLSYPHSAKD